MQLAAFNSSSFMLGHAAMAINEGLPNFLVDQLSRRHTLEGLKVGILGMAFKADIDDTRDSLSYKLGKILRFKGAEVLYSDEFARDPTFVSKETLVASVDVAIVGVPHSAYRTLAIPSGVEVVDLWSVLPVDQEKR
jgi:UDP-N-acetyl-D-mannosaminuronic acid dehydrogenase